MKHPVTLLFSAKRQNKHIMVTLDEETSRNSRIESTYGLTVSTEKLKMRVQLIWSTQAMVIMISWLLQPTLRKRLYAIKEMVARFDVERYAKWLMGKKACKVIPLSDYLIVMSTIKSFTHQKMVERLLQQLEISKR